MSEAHNLSREEAETLALHLAAREERAKRRKLFMLYPDEGPLRRELYPKHLEFFRAGVTHRERCFMAGNRVGKTEGGGGYELALHLTGWYPDWWVGKRFNRPITAWAAGKTTQKTKEILQSKILGQVTVVDGRKTMDGTGLIPGEWLGRAAFSKGDGELVETIRVKYFLGGWSTLTLKSYEQGRDAFEGTEIDAILLDEEPPMEVYSECNIRTMATTGNEDDDGIIMLTFTPLDGHTDVVLSFLPQEMRPEGFDD